MRRLFLLAMLFPIMASAQEKEIDKKDRLKFISDSTMNGWKLTKDSDSIRRLYMSKKVTQELKETSGIFPPEAPNNALGFQLSVDQDAFYSKKNEDRDYTMGLLATIIGHLRKNRIIGFNQDEKEKDDNRFLASFGFSGFTPLNIQYKFVDYTDRPYSAIAFINYDEIYSFKPFWHTTNEKTSLAHGFRQTFILGTMGKGTSNTAKFIQTAIHSGQRATEADPSDVRPDPQGWGFAVAHNNKFPVVANYNAEYSILFSHTLWPQTKLFQPLKFTAKPTAGINIGTLYDNVSLGVNYQFGFLGKDMQFGPIVFKDLKDKIKKIRIGASIIGDAFIQGWAHNATLNGILWRDNADTYVIRHKDMEHLTWYRSLGGMISVNNVKLGYSVYVRSKVIEVSNRKQYFGRAFLKIDID